MEKYNIDYDFLQNESYDREVAKSFFPDFFGHISVILNSFASLDMLDDKYREYLAKYFNLFGEKNDDDRREIARSYVVLKRIMKARDEFNSNRNNVNDFLNSYNALIEFIGSYKFIPICRFNPETMCDEDTHSSFQNDANAIALERIQSFEPFVSGILNTFNKLLIVYRASIEVDALYCHLIDFLNYWKEKFSITLDRLDNCEDEYHLMWDIAHGRGYHHSSDYWNTTVTNWDLGEYRKDWRQAKNEACNTLLYFWESLFELYMTLSYNNLIPPVDSNDSNLTEEITREYQKNMEFLRKSPVYFCFLDDTQKKELAEMKKARKKQDYGLLSDSIE